jgi:hypothetical protein
VLAERLRVLTEIHPHLYARRGAVSFLHPFGGEKVHRTFSSFRLTPLEGGGDELPPPGEGLSMDGEKRTLSSAAAVGGSWSILLKNSA